MYDIPTYKLSLVREGTTNVERRQIDSSSVSFNILQWVLKDLDREHFVVVLLDAKLNAIGINTVAIGTLTQALVHPREVFKAAILANAAAVIVSHNHPSGDPTPSTEDDQLTRRIWQAGELLGIQVLDHVIVGDGRYYSYADRGRLS